MASNGQPSSNLVSLPAAILPSLPDVANLGLEGRSPLISVTPRDEPVLPSSNPEEDEPTWMATDDSPPDLTLLSPSATIPPSPDAANRTSLNFEGKSPIPSPSGGSETPGEVSSTAGPGEEGMALKRPIHFPNSANEHELRVFPDEHTILDDALLKCTPYVVNTKHMVLICTDCRYCIVPDRALVHLGQEHAHCKVETTFPEKLNPRFPGLIAAAIQPLETIEAVFGLGIPIEKYLVCSRCRRGYINMRTLERHVCRNAEADSAGQPEYFLSYVQTFFRGQRICYFPVELPGSSSDGTNGSEDDFDIFKTDFQEPAVSEGQVHGSEDYRELNQFLGKEGWIKHVSGFSPSGLSLLTGLPKDGEVLKLVARDVSVLMCSIQAAIGGAGYYVRRLLGKRPAYVFSFSIPRQISD
jgi:hypothetical protein